MYHIVYVLYRIKVSMYHILYIVLICALASGQEAYSQISIVRWLACVQNRERALCVYSDLNREHASGECIENNRIG